MTSRASIPSWAFCAVMLVAPSCVDGSPDDSTGAASDGGQLNEKSDSLEDRCVPTLVVVPAKYNFRNAKTAIPETAPFSIRNLGTCRATELSVRFSSPTSQYWITEDWPKECNGCPVLPPQGAAGYAPLTFAVTNQPIPPEPLSAVIELDANGRKKVATVVLTSGGSSDAD